METKTHYIVAIDFGTSRTGFAWCIRGAIAGNGDINVRKSWPGLPNDYVKTYTELYHDPQHNKWYFGGEARQIRLTGRNFNGDKVEGSFYKEYKMHLYDVAQDSDKDETMTLIVETLKKMKEYVLDNMKAILGGLHSFSDDILEKDTQWVLTVPEGATDVDKAFMREAAEKAGLIKKGNEDFDRLLFALEPEAGIIACIKENVTWNMTQEERVVVVFDAGGGTVDVTVRRFVPKNGSASAKLESIEGVRGDCAPAGSKYMNEFFWHYLRGLFGEKVWDDFCYGHQEEYQKLLMDWLKGKELTAGYQPGKNFIISVDVRDLWDILRDISPSEYDALMDEIDNSPDETIIRNNFEYQFSGRRYRYLTISRDKFIKIFHQVFENAYMPLKNVLKQLEEQKVICDSLFFIGGFSCNPCLREFIKEHISEDFTFLKEISYVEMDSDKMCSAVLYGAALYANDPGFIADRVVKLTYGVDCVINDEEDCFSALIKSGDKISSDKEVQHTFHPRYPDQKRCAFRFFSTDRTDVRKSTDSSLIELEKVTIDCPDITGGCDREILVTLKFGGTETTATILDKTSGNWERISLHVPFKWSNQ